jgi:diacylglycerol kinase family enzyme
MRALLFHNPTAGAGQVSRRDLMAACRLAGLAATYCSTKSRGYAKMLTKPTDIVVIAGGDGTVARIVCAVAERSVPVGIVPLGNANNIARSLGISGLPQELAESWCLGHTIPLNIGAVSGPWGRRKFAEAVGLGPLAYAIKNDGKRKMTGADNLRQGRDALRNALLKAKPLDLKMSVDGKVLRGPMLGVEITNIRYAGPALPIAPRAEPGDGMLDIVWIGPADLARALQWLEAPHERPAPFQSTQGRAVSLAWHRTPLRIDDEIIEPGESVAAVGVKLTKSVVNIVVPPMLIENRRSPAMRSPQRRPPSR